MAKETPKALAPHVALMLQVWHAVPTGALVDYLADAVRQGDVASAEALRIGFQSRPNHAEYLESFSATFAGLQTSECDEAQQRLSRVVQSHAWQSIAFLELMRGKSNPEARLRAFRAA